ncbi:MAG TPA: TetR/AcrR family transcriptional regulator [Gemmatimonadaceae bacterium]|nr:TetR/AcrR family transcriptional regulator [Gemmatimonadaceae bacterium]
MTNVSRTVTVGEMARPKEFDRDEALRSALSIFRKKGFSATSTDDLRLAMGIGRQSFYDTFKGKKEIYLEALRQYNSDRVLGYFEIFRKSDSPIKAIEDMLVSIALEHPQERTLACLGVASICEFGAADADVRAINDASASAMQSVLEKLLAEAKAKKKLRPSLNPATTAAYLQSTLAGLRVTARAGASREALKAIAMIAVDGLKPQ